MNGKSSNKGWVERDSTWEGMEGIDREWMEVIQKRIIDILRWNRMNEWEDNRKRTEWIIRERKEKIYRTQKTQVKWNIEYIW